MKLKDANSTPGRVRWFSLNTKNVPTIFRSKVDIIVNHSVEDQ